MSKLGRLGLPLLVLAAGLGAGVLVIQTAPEAQRRPPERELPTVEVVEATPRSYPVTLETQGTVAPRTQSSLVAEVAGRVVEVAEALRGGGFFEPGQKLLEIDPRDYENAVIIARSEVAGARLALREEKARGEQARIDWRRLGLDGEPDSLALRQPQLASARARVAAAEARLEQARIDLQRTRVEAPYAGRVLEKNVDVGQYVTPGTVLAHLYAVDYVEIRLPLNNQQLQYVELPERYRDTDHAAEPPAARIHADIGGVSHAWEGRVIRVEGSIDAETRQWFVVARVDDPYARRDGRPPLKVGQFVTVEIQGQRLQDVYVLPRTALRPGDEVLTVSPGRLLDQRPVQVMWRTDDEVVLRGLSRGEEVVIGAVPFAVTGTRVRVAGDPPPTGGERDARGAREPG